MKKILSIILFVVVLLLASYYGMGLLTERSIKHTVNVLQTMNKIDLKLVDYHRGFFCSQAKLNWTFHVPPREVPNPNGGMKTISGMDYVIPVPLSIHHGPMIFTGHGVKFALGNAESRLTIPKTYLEHLKPYFSASSSLPVVNLSLLAHFSDYVTLNVDIPSFQLMMLAKRTQFDWSGLNSTTVLSFDLGKMNGSSVLDGVQLSQSSTQIKLGKVKSGYELHMTVIGLYEGSASIGLSNVTVTADGRPQMNLSGLDVETDSTVKSGLWHSHFKGEVKQILLEDQHYGPGVIEIFVKNLDAAVLVRMQEQLKSLQTASIKARQKALWSLIPEMPRLFAKGAAISIPTFRFVMPEGELSGNMNIALPEGELRNPFQIVAQVVGSAHLQMPAVLVQEMMADVVRQKLQAPQPPADVTSSPEAAPVAVIQGEALEQQAKALAQKQLTSLTDSGVLVLNGKAYVLDLTLEKGHIAINGKPFTPSMFEF